jgi:Flp pilus assembly protein TadD
MQKRWIHPAILVIVTFLVWGISLRNGFVWDDRILIQKNEANISRISFSTAFLSDFWSTDTEAGRSNYYRPLVTLSYMVDYALFGLQPIGYHATNLAIHAAGVVCLWYLLVLLGVSSGGAAIAASVWAVHPAVAESVAWISGRTDSLATMFMLLSVVAALRGLAGKKVDTRFAYVSLASFAAALLCKESAIVTPILIAIFLAFHGKSGRMRGAFAFQIVAIGVIWFLLRSMVLQRPLGLASGEGASLSIAVLSLFHVWGNLVWPGVFRIEYGSSLTPQALLGGALLGGVLLLWVLFVLGAKHGPRPTRYLYLAALVAFIPSVMAVVLKSMIGSRLIYSTAAFALAGFAFGLQPERRSQSQRTFLVCVLVALAVTSIYRTQLWISDTVLFTKALEAPDASTRNHLNLGLALYESGDLAGALDHLSRNMESAALDQKHYMLSLLFTAIRCETLAEDNLVKAIAANSGSFSAIHNLAGLRAVQGRHEDARRGFAEIAERDPSVRMRALAQLERLKSLSHLPARPAQNAPWCSDDRARAELFSSAVTLNRLAGEHLRSAQLELAEILIRAALRVDPWFVAARLNLAQLHLLRGEREKSRETLESILNTNPDEERARRLLSAIDAGALSGPSRLPPR